MSEKLSDQVTLSTSAQQGPDLPGACYVRALSGNTGKVYVGNNGSNGIATTTGYELAPGEALPFYVRNLSDFYFVAATNGDKVCWIRA